MSSTDPNLPRESFSYSLVSGEGSTDNSSFAISGNSLRTATALDGTQAAYSIRVRVTDSGGLAYEKVFRLYSALPGDTNSDGSVDIFDLNRALANYNRSGATWDQGDFTGDGAVAVEDLNKLLTNYNQHVGQFAKEGDPSPRDRDQRAAERKPAAISAMTMKRVDQPKASRPFRSPMMPAALGPRAVPLAFAAACDRLMRSAEPHDWLGQGRND